MPGTVVVGHKLLTADRRMGREVEVITADWTADAADGSIPDTGLGTIAGTLLRLMTNPGTPAPTAAYDVVIEDEDGFDVLGGLGANRSATITEEGEIKGTTYRRIVGSALTLKISGNIVNGAKGIVRLYVARALLDG